MSLTLNISFLELELPVVNPCFMKGRQHRKMSTALKLTRYLKRASTEVETLKFTYSDGDLIEQSEKIIKLVYVIYVISLEI